MPEFYDILGIYHMFLNIHGIPYQAGPRGLALLAFQEPDDPAAVTGSTGLPRLYRFEADGEGMENISNAWYQPTVIGTSEHGKTGGFIWMKLDIWTKYIQIWDLYGFEPLITGKNKMEHGGFIQIQWG